jgi:predicted Rossmann-fold nucleotide-binding protein
VNSTDIKNLPAGSTIILSTTSADKKAEYAELYKAYDLNFFTLEDFGLSPQKTEEATGTYEGNLLEKGIEVSRLLHENIAAIQNILTEKRIDISNPILGMVEDSGIDIFPEDEADKERFIGAFKQELKTRMLDQFDRDGALQQETFGNMPEAAHQARMKALHSSSDWILDSVDVSAGFPGANFKNFMEKLRGGFIEFMDAMHIAAEDKPLRFRNHAHAMLVAPYEKANEVLKTKHIVRGISEGTVANQAQFAAILEQRRGAVSDDQRDHYATGALFTADAILPDGQGENPLSRQALVDRHGLLQSKNSDLCEDYRLDCMQNLAAEHRFPIIEKNKTPLRAENTSPLRVMVMHPFGSEETDAYKTLCAKLQEQGVTTVRMPTQAELLADRNIGLMDQADIAIILPTDDPKDIQNLRLLVAATVDKQTLPANKETSLYVYNPNGAFDPALAIINDINTTGRKFGISEIKQVVSSDNLADLFAKLPAMLTAEAERKKSRLTGVQPITTKLHDASPQNLESVSESVFSVGVFGGVANENPLYKEPADQLGRFIYDQGWALITGAGQKEGPMGATHSGFVEAYLKDKLSNPSLRTKVMQEVSDAVDALNVKENRHGRYANDYKRDVLAALNPDAIDAEFLGHHAPRILKILLSPKKDRALYDLLGSLEESKRLIGYSMPPLLISEGSGKPPAGMFYQHTGNMQRRMEQMMKATTHVFCTGGQGTIQELVESLTLAVELNATAAETGAQVKDIHLLNQLAYGVDRLTYDKTLELIDDYLDSKNLTREEVGLKISRTPEELEAKLRETKSKWQSRETTRRELPPEEARAV